MKMDIRRTGTMWVVAFTLVVALAPAAARSHGDVNPQPVDTKATCSLGGTMGHTL